MTGGGGRRAIRLAAAGIALVTAGTLAGCTGDSGGGSAAAAAASASSASAASHRPAPSRSTATRDRWYLSLGDSIAFGFQEARFTRLLHAGSYRPAAFPGYTGRVARSLRSAGGRPVRVVNYGCPGETTLTFAVGGCPFRFSGARLHDPYPGAQLAAAETFLRRHRGAVALVTLAIGANDLSGLRGRCRLDIACFRRGVGAVSHAAAARLARATRVLARLARPAPVVVLLPYDPLAVDAPATVGLLEAYNGRLAAGARKAGAAVVDALPDFNAGGGAGRICALTLYCGPGRDTHPSDAGYAELGRLIARAVRTAR